MTERFQDVLDSEGNVVARVIDNRQHPANQYPWWLEVSEGYSVVEGKQACHDRREEKRSKVRPK